MKFTYYTDPGHGWIRVKKQLLIQLNIAFDISNYSYMKGNSAYLEEDCDLQKLSDALIKVGKTLELIQKHTNKNSRIRSYAKYFQPQICWPSYSNPGNYIYTNAKTL
jgi:hypothetical protein